MEAVEVAVSQERLANQAKVLQRLGAFQASRVTGDPCGPCDERTSTWCALRCWCREGLGLTTPPSDCCDRKTMHSALTPL